MRIRQYYYYCVYYIFVLSLFSFFLSWPFHTSVHCTDVDLTPWDNLIIILLYYVLYYRFIRYLQVDILLDRFFFSFRNYDPEASSRLLIIRIISKYNRISATTITRRRLYIDIRIQSAMMMGRLWSNHLKYERVRCTRILLKRFSYCIAVQQGRSVPFGLTITHV